MKIIILFSLIISDILKKKFTELMEDEENPWYNNTIISVYDPTAEPKLDKKFILYK